MSTDYTPYLPFCHQLADAAGAVIRKYFRRKSWEVELKEDKSPVTVADRMAEGVMREMIMGQYPDHGIWGEEFGKLNENAEYVWVLDPIDGTKSFISGKPLFGTLISLTHKGIPVVGVIDQPVLYDRWLGVSGAPTIFNEFPALASGCTALSDAVLSTTSPDLLPGDSFRKFTQVKEKAKYTIYGSDCYAYGLLASGHLDIVMEYGLNAYDFCALIPVLQGAGASVSDWQGNPVTMHSKGDLLASASPALHNEILTLIK